VTSEVVYNPSNGFFERTATLGQMLMGGPDSASDNTSTSGDVIYNNFSYPIVITSAQPMTTAALSGDNCFFLNVGGIWQVNASWNGELMCVGASGQQAIAGMNYGSRGVLIKPGDRLIYQSTSPAGTGQINLATVTLAPATSIAANAVMSRMRFPRWDSGTTVPANSTLTVGAGCAGPSCAIVPVGPAGPNQLVQSSNYWFVAPVHTAIRGMTLYNGSVSGTLRVAQQGGANIATYSFSQPSLLTGGMNAFTPLDIDVPQGALVGIDYNLINSTGGAGTIDFVGYVWFDQSTPFTPPADY
jgi:hypothetical protein